MKKYIILTGKYLPKPGATGICVHQVALELWHRGNNVTVICYQDNELTDSDTIIVKKIKIPSFFDDVSSKSELFRKISHFKSIVSKLVHINKYPLRSYRLVSRYEKEVIKNIESSPEQKIILIATLNPLEAVIAARNVKKRFPNRINLVYYNLDTLSNEKSDNGYLSSEYRMNCGLKWEKQLFPSFDKIIIMECHKEHYFSTIFHDVEPKMVTANFPLFIHNNSIDINKEKKYITFVYTGTLYRKMRNPLFLCNTLIQLQDKFDYRAFFLGSGDCNDILEDAVNRSNGKICTLGMQTHDKALQKICEADVLLSIGNKNSQMVPSKIYEYMSTGKPIIHFFTSEMDICIELLKKYGNSLIIREGDPTVLSQINTFVKEIHVMDFRVVSEKFKSSSPSFTADIIEQI